MRYKNTSKNKENGVFYTPTRMADYVATEMLKYSPINKNRKSISILYCTSITFTEAIYLMSVI